MLTHVANLTLIYQQVIHTSSPKASAMQAHLKQELRQADTTILLKTHAPTSSSMVIISKNI